MTVTTRRLTFAEYCHYHDGTNARYELVDGELVTMGIGSGRHAAIMKLLERAFDAACDRPDRSCIALPGTVGIRSPRGRRWDTVRIPDVVVLTTEQWQNLQNREAIVDLQEPPPLLVVEVVSASTKSTDYRAKRSEYGAIDIPEYWIVDPLEEKVTVLVLVEGWYDATEFTGSERILSPTFPEIDLTAERVLSG